MARPYSYTLECAFGSNPDTALSSQTWTDITRYLDVQHGVTITRGRADENAAVQPATMGLVLDNRDGRFTMGNAASPYHPNVIPGKRIRLGLLWPGNGKQLYTFATLGTTGTALGDPSFEGTGAFGFGADLTGAPTIAQSSAQAFHGTKSMSLTWPVAAAGRAYRYMRGLIPGRTYTVSAYVYAPTGSPDPTLTVNGSGGASTSTKNAWTRLQQTFVCPAIPAGTLHFFTVQATGIVGTVTYVDAVQIEEAATASAFEPTGAVFSWRFTGDSQAWPLRWLGGSALYAEGAVSAADRLAKLSDLRQFQQLIVEDVLDDFPVAFYPLGEPELSPTAGDISGNDQPPLVGQQVGVGGSIAFGQKYVAATSSTVAIQPAPDFYKDRATAAGFFPVDASNGRFLTTLLKAPVVSATGSTVIAYARESTSPVTTGAVASFAAADGSWLGIDKQTGTGNITARFFNAKTGVLSEVASGVGLGTNKPSLFAAVLDIPSPGNGRLTFYANGNATGTPVTFTMAAVPSWNRVNVGGRSKVTFRGDVSFASFYPAALTSGAIVAQWYSAFRGTDGIGFTTTARVIKLAGFAGLGSVTTLFQGTNSPRSAGAQEIIGNALDAIRLAETTEDGLFYLDGAGQPTFQLRSYRFNRAPDLTITADRIDPDSVAFRGDDFGLVNDVTASRPDGAAVRVINQTSVDASGRRTATITAVSGSDSELRILAAWQANVTGALQNRLTGLRISLLNDPGLVATALLLTQSQKIRVTALPGQAPAVALEVGIEGWTEKIGETEWSMEFATSPATAVDVWQIGVAGHSEIGTTTRIGY